MEVVGSEEFILHGHTDVTPDDIVWCAIIYNNSPMQIRRYFIFKKTILNFV